LRDDSVQIATQYRCRIGQILLCRQLTGALLHGVPGAQHQLRQGQIGAVVGKAAAEQLHQQQPQSEHIRGRADRLTQQLLWRRISGCEAGDGGLALGVVHQLGNAEIQQMGLTLRVDQYVGRLEVAVDHQLSMRRMHGLTDLLKQAQPIRQGRALGLRPLGQ
jgi:hypothetical protein